MWEAQAQSVGGGGGQPVEHLGHTIKLMSRRYIKLRVKIIRFQN